MAQSLTVGAFVNRIERYQKAVDRAPNAMVRNIATAGRAIMQVEAQQASGGDGRLSKVGRSGAKLGVTARVDNVTDTVTFKARGPWQLVEFPTKAHLIASQRFAGPRAGRGLKVSAGNARLRRGYVGRREAALRTPFGPRMFVRHPGSRSPKKPWAKGRRQILEIAPRIARETARAEFAKAQR